MLRLKQRWQFLRVASAGQKFVTPSLIVQAFQNEEDNKRQVLRVGYTASKKVGGAIERNRTKRRLRAAAEEIMPKHARLGYDFVLIGRKGTLKMKFPKIIKDLKTALKNLETYIE